MKKKKKKIVLKVVIAEQLFEFAFQSLYNKLIIKWNKKNNTRSPDWNWNYVARKKSSENSYVPTIIVNIPPECIWNYVAFYKSIYYYNKFKL